MNVNVIAKSKSSSRTIQILISPASTFSLTLGGASESSAKQIRLNGMHTSYLQDFQRKWIEELRVPRLVLHAFIPGNKSQSDFIVGLLKHC